MKIIESKIIPFPGYLAINLFGIVFTRNLIRFLSKPSNLRHEYTHTLQWKELWYIGFLPLYIYYYLKNLIWYRMNAEEAYKNNPLEAEAYKNHDIEGYNDSRKRFAWKKYTKISK